MRAISGDAHFFEETMNMERIRRLLDNKLGVAGHAEKLEAMKALLASVSKGEDVSGFFPDVVKNVIVASVEVKKLVYIYLVHYADMNAQCRELALLSINSFQKDLADPNPLIRALALRVLTSIRVKDIVQIQMLAIRKCAQDESPYVRKCAATAVGKLSAAADDEIRQSLVDLIGELLLDSSTMVLGSAVMALNEVCADRLDLLHAPYRKLCYLLADLDEWGQTIAIQLLTRYAREQFHPPDKTDASRDDDQDHIDPFSLQPKSATFGSAFQMESQTSKSLDELDEDQRLLLRSSIPLLKSRNSAVVLAVATLHYYCGVPGHDATSTLLGKSLVRLLRGHREIQFVVLNAIKKMAQTHASMFRPFLPDFFVRATDASYAREAKLSILTALACEKNVEVILREFQAYVRHVDKKFVTSTIRALASVADALPDVADTCIGGLLKLTRASDDAVVAQSVVVIRQLLQKEADAGRKEKVVRSLAARVVSNQVKDASARASVVWMLGEFQDDGLQSCALESLRLLTCHFADEEAEVRLQLLTLAVKVALKSEVEESGRLLQYVLELCKFDRDYDIRDRGRLVRAALSAESPGVDPVKLFVTGKPAPKLQLTSTVDKFTLGSLSDLVGQAAPGYLALPEWRSDPVESKLRDESTQRKVSTPSVMQSSSKSKTNGAQEDFYSDSSDSESGSESNSNSESESSASESESGSESESESGSDSESESEDGSESEEEEKKETKTEDPLDFLGGSTNTTSGTLVDDLMNLGFDSPAPQMQSPMVFQTSDPIKRTLLSIESSGGLHIDYAFLRQASSHAPTMSVVQLWASNRGQTPLSRISVHPPADSQLSAIASAEIPVLFPGGAPSMTQVHLDFGGKLSPILLQVSAAEVETAMEVTLTPVVGELLSPASISATEFGTQLSSCGAEMMDKIDVSGLGFDKVVQKLLQVCNVGQVYEPVTNGHVQQAKFAGSMRDNMVLLAVEVEASSGKGQVLVASGVEGVSEALAEEIRLVVSE